MSARLGQGFRASPGERPASTLVASARPRPRSRDLLSLAAIAPVFLWLWATPAVPAVGQRPEAGQTIGPWLAIADAPAPSRSRLVPGTTRPLRELPEARGHVLEQVAAAQSLGDPAARSAALQEEVERLSVGESLRLLAAEAQDPGSGLSPEFTRLVLTRLAAREDGGLERWARDLPETPMRMEALTAVGLYRCRTGQEAALEWARGLGQAPSEINAALQVATELAGVVPVEAVDLAARMPASPQRDQCLVHCVAQWAGTDPVGAAGWAVGAGDGALRERMLNRVLTAMAVEEPWAAAAWTAGSLPAGRRQSATALAVVQRWAQRDPQAARAWVESFPDEGLRQQGLTAIEQAIASAGREPSPAK